MRWDGRDCVIRSCVREEVRMRLYCDSGILGDERGMRASVVSNEADAFCCWFGGMCRPSDQPIR